MSAKTLLITLGLTSLLFSESLFAQSPGSKHTLTPGQAVERALQQDLWLVRNQYQQNSLESKQVVSNSLPDPQVSLDLLNLSSDSLDFSQEPMTQLKLGFSQMLPRGNSRALNSQRYALQAGEKAIQREDRRAGLAVQVLSLWLDAYKAKQSLRLLSENRSLFLELVDVAERAYSSAYGKTRQQDVLRANLELTRLDDRVLVVQERYERALSKLSEWITADDLIDFDVSNQAPELVLIDSATPFLSGKLSRDALLEAMKDHPSIRCIDQQLQLRRANIDLAQQKYKPQWGLRASYAYRDEDASGRGRDDFLSVGVIFDVPLFTSNRQDREVQSERSLLDADKTEKVLALNKMLAEAKSLRDSLLRLNQRQSLYKDTLLLQMSEQAESALNAYLSDSGDFSEVARARIAELNTKVEMIGITTERFKAITKLNYIFTQKPASLAEVL